MGGEFSIDDIGYFTTVFHISSEAFPPRCSEPPFFCFETIQE